MTTSLSNFTNLYQLSKTLRFELIPQGKTLEYIEEKGLINEDEKRAESYKTVKKIIDEYHKDFIEEALAGLELNELADFQKLYLKANKEKKEIKELLQIQARMRKQIADRFSKHPVESISSKYSNIFKKELIQLDLPSSLHSDEDKALIREFDRFTTYFTGFHNNRKNMYSAEEKSTAISFRLINENLPKFIDNLKIFSTIKDKYNDLKFDQLFELTELLDIRSVDDFFNINTFNTTLTQNGISKYNDLLGGFTERERKIKGLNELINLYRQKKKLNKRELPNIAPLYKQILSDRTTISFLPETFENDNELLESIKKYYFNELTNWTFENDNLLNSVRNLLMKLSKYNLSKIFIRNDQSLTDISNKIFGDWSIITNALRYYYENEINPLKGKRTKKYEDSLVSYISNSKQFSINVIENSLIEYKMIHNEIGDKVTNHTICDYFADFEITDKADGKTVKFNIFNQINTAYGVVKNILNDDYPGNKNLGQDTKSVALIKEFLESIKALLWHIKPIHIGLTIDDKDESFYNDYMLLFDQLNKITPLYDMTRNYLTKKPYSTEKIKLNFENSTLLDGWDANKETDNTSVLLIKNEKYYLAIMDKNHNRIFQEIPQSNGGDYYHKVHYKLLPGVNKMLPKVFFSKSRIEEFAPSTSIIENYKKGTHKKGDNFNLKHCHSLIDFFKSSINIHPDWKHFDFKFSETSTYNDLSDFYREVSQQGYKITYQKIPITYIEKLVNDGKLYLFQIYNKDFSPHSKGRPNLHTIYWKMLFDEDNLKDVAYKLNGQAEIFYRKKSLNVKDTITHKADTNLRNKNVLNKKQYSKFDYDIIKDRRYTCDKFQFHVPITLNFKAKGFNNINTEINNYLQNNPNAHIIGIDRGERNLLYISVIDQKGNIKEQFSLNEIINEYKGNTYKTDYHQLLDDKETERKKARVNWGTIENIKELKQGYLSQVVHKICRLIVKYNAVIAMEDLNFGFKRGRIKVEKQVYQKFEKMLIDKLNYLVFKEVEQNQPTGMLKALQLTNKFESFKKLGKQCGIVYYVPAWNTSKIDPITGFVNLFYTKYESVAKAQAFFRKFNKIYYDANKDHFEFSFDYQNFTLKADGTKTEWVACADNQSRYRWNRNLNQGIGGYEQINVANQISDLFAKYNIAFGNGDNLIPLIVSQEKAEFYKILLNLFSVMVSLRHNNGKKGAEEEDKVLSPVLPFFDSSQAKDKQPCDADANGAYHIALKGLWIKNQIDSADDLNKLKLAISNKEWLNWVQERPFQL